MTGDPFAWRGWGAIYRAARDWHIRRYLSARSASLRRYYRARALEEARLMRSAQ